MLFLRQNINIFLLYINLIVHDLEGGFGSDATTFSGGGKLAGGKRIRFRMFKGVKQIVIFVLHLPSYKRKIFKSYAKKNRAL